MSTIYILTNPSMPDLVKIGMTSNMLESRIAELSRATGVPLPFEVYYACEVDDMKFVENAIHDGFKDFRINPKREFFKIDPERVISILKLVAKKDVTPIKDIVDTPEEQKALDTERNRRAKFSFEFAKISIGSQIRFYFDENKIAQVINNTEIMYNGEIYSLNQITLKLFKEMGRIWKSVQGPAYWLYENETLKARRERLEDGDIDI